MTGVVGAYPVYVQSRAFLWRSPAHGSRRQIRVVAFDPADPVLDDPDIEASQPWLQTPETVLIDRKSSRFSVTPSRARSVSWPSTGSRS